MRRERYTPTQIIKALQHTRGMLTLAAERLHCDYHTIQNYANRYPSVAEELKRQREYTTDIAELKLYEAITNGESWAIQYYLRTQGKSRGYVERHEVTGAEGESLRPLVHIYLPMKAEVTDVLETSNNDNDMLPESS